MWPEELLQVRLVPDLPVADRECRLSGMLKRVEPRRGPVEAAGAIALHRLGEELPPHLELLRRVDRRHVWAVGDVAGRSVNHGEHHDALARERAHDAVEAGP